MQNYKYFIRHVPRDEMRYKTVHIQSKSIYGILIRYNKSKAVIDFHCRLTIVSFQQSQEM